MSGNNQPPTEDQIDQIKLLHVTHTRFLASQSDQSKELTTKTTFLFGFVVSVMTLYGTYAKHANGTLRLIALAAFSCTLLALCYSIRLKTFNRPPLLDDTVADDTSHFNKLYQDVINIGETTKENDAGLKNDQVELQRAIWLFTAAMILMAISLVAPQKTVLHSKHHGKSAHTTHQPSSQTPSSKPRSL